MNFAKRVLTLFVCWCYCSSISATNYSTNQRSRMVCGGHSREHPTRHRGSIYRNLHSLGQKLDAINILADHIITAYRDLELPTSPNMDFTCVNEMIPEVLSVNDVNRNNMADELIADNQVLIELHKILNLVQQNGNDPDLFMAESQFTLENLLYDALCSVNKAARALDIHLPRSIDTSARVDTCNVGNHLFSRLTRDYALFRQMKIVMRELFLKYHFAAQLYR